MEELRKPVEFVPPSKRAGWLSVWEIAEALGMSCWGARVRLGKRKDLEWQDVALPTGGKRRYYRLKKGKKL